LKDFHILRLCGASSEKGHPVDGFVGWAALSCLDSIAVGPKLILLTFFFGDRRLSLGAKEFEDFWSGSRNLAVRNTEIECGDPHLDRPGADLWDRIKSRLRLEELGDAANVQRCVRGHGVEAKGGFDVRDQ
jgi:lipopolysaccharide biosynthesis protein